MPFNRVRQDQIKSQIAKHLLEQLNAVEDRTRAVAKLRYEEKSQWDNSLVLTNIDTDSVINQIQLADNGGVFHTTGTVESYVVDTGAYNTEWEGFEFTQDKPGGTNILYYTRTGDVEAPDGTWTSWETISDTAEGWKIQSDRGRYIQFKIVISTTDTAVTPTVSSVVLSIWGSPGTQEVFDSRGGYTTLSQRLDSLNNVYQKKVIAAQDQVDIAIEKQVTDETILKVYVNGNLQNYGDAAYDAYQITGEDYKTITFNQGLDAGDVVICRIEGAGAGVITVKENVIVDEEPTTTDRETYTLVRTPIFGKEEVYLSGIKVVAGAENDYVLSGNDIVFNYTVDEDFVVTCTYYYI